MHEKSGIAIERIPSLRLALDYPDLQAARKQIREHETEALAYFRTISDHDPQHPNAEYALGVALMELEQDLEAEPHLKNALKLAKLGALQYLQTKDTLKDN